MHQRPLNEEISVVVQGALCVHTSSVLASIRQYLPGAEIILSTWKGSDCTGLDYDILLLNEDPGGCVTSPSGTIQNLNRQLLSTKNGIKAATRRYILKLRSDILLTGNTFLTYWKSFPKRENEYALFSERILICSFYTRPPRWKKQAYLYHPSDWCSFGTREDMLLLWDIPLVIEPKFSQYFREDCISNRSKNKIWTRFFPEQYFFITCLEQNGFHTGVSSQRDYSEELASRSQHFLMNNFLILDYGKLFTISCCSYPNTCCDTKIQHHRQFLYFYKKYCDKHSPIKRIQIWREVLGIEDILDKIKFHIFRIKNHRHRIGEVIGQSLGIFYYLLIAVLRGIWRLPHLLFYS